MDNTAQSEETTADICVNCGVICWATGYPTLCDICEFDFVVEVDQDLYEAEMQ